VPHAQVPVGGSRPVQVHVAVRRDRHDVGGGRDGVQPSVQTDQGSGEEELPDDSRRQQDANLLSAHSVSKLIGLLRQGTSRLKRGSPTNSST